MKKRKIQQQRMKKNISLVYNYNIKKVKRKGFFLGKSSISTVISNLKKKKQSKDLETKRISADLIQQSKIFNRSIILTDNAYMDYMKEQKVKRLSRKTASMMNFRNKISFMKALNQKAKLSYMNNIVNSLGVNKEKLIPTISKTRSRPVKKSFKKLRKMFSNFEIQPFYSKEKTKRSAKFAKTTTKSFFKGKKEKEREVSLIELSKKRKSINELNSDFLSNKAASMKKFHMRTKSDPAIKLDFTLIKKSAQQSRNMLKKKMSKTNVEIIDDKRPKNMDIKRFRKAQVLKMKHMFLKEYKKKVKNQSDNYGMKLKIEKKKMKLFQDVLQRRNFSITKSIREKKAYLTTSYPKKIEEKIIKDIDEEEEDNDYNDYEKKFRKEFEEYMDMVNMGIVSKTKKEKFKKFMRYHKGLIHDYRFVENPEYHSIDLDNLRQFKDFTNTGDINKMLHE